MPLARRAAPFDHPDWIFELKYDGFRALAYLRNGTAQLISRRDNQFKSFPALCDAIGHELKADAAIVDGEIVCLDGHGRSRFNELLYRRGEPCFVAFDVLWADGEDMRYLPLIDRKLRLRSIVPRQPSRLLYCDYVESHGTDLFRLVCEQDLEGIVAKWKGGPYLSADGETSWLKIRNRNYSQMQGRREQFERLRERAELAALRNVAPQFRCDLLELQRASGHANSQ